VPDAYTQADLLRWHLTGAGSDGGAQADPAASIGAYRSSTEVEGIGVRLEQSIPGVRVRQVAGENGLGLGSIEASQGAWLQWADPNQGDAVSTPVHIANGETKVLEGAEPGRFVRVERVTAEDLRGGMAVRLVERFDALFDDIGNSERSAGDTEYRCLCARAGGPGVVHLAKIWLGLVGTAGAVDSSGYAASGAVTVTSKTTLADWPATGYAKNEATGETLYYEERTDDALTVAAGGRDVWSSGAAAGSEDDVLSPVPGFAIGLEAPSAQPDGTFDAPANESTTPAAVTFYTPTAEDDGNVLELPTLEAGQIYGLWIARKIPASAAAEPWARFVIKWSFVAVG